MKNLKLLLLTFILIFSSCDLDEDPPYLDEGAYNNTNSVLGTLDGIYAGLANYDAQGVTAPVIEEDDEVLVPQDADSGPVAQTQCQHA